VEARGEDEYRRWLCYWLLFGAASCANLGVRRIVPWIPFYNALRVAFCAWAMLPQTRGAEWFLASIAEPSMAGYESRIDRELSALQSRAAQASQKLGGYLRIFIAEGLRTVSDQVRDADAGGQEGAGVGGAADGNEGEGWVEAVGPLGYGDEGEG
jgi:hypothetical protein